MKQITLNNKEYLLVDVPYLHNIHINVDNTYGSRVYCENNKNDSFEFDCKYIDLNTKNIFAKYQMIGVVSDILKDEDICEGLIEKVMNGQHYQNYNYKSIVDRWVKTATDSFLSYLQSIDLDLTKSWLLIQKL